MNAKHRMSNVTDVRHLLDYLFGLLSNQDEMVRRQVESWLREKRRSYSGSAYLDQMERNAIYLFERVRLRNATSVLYLRTGEPVVDSEEQAIQYMRILEIEEAQERARAHTEYVRTGTCSGCAMHQDHQTYSQYVRLRQAGNLSEYLETVEFDAVYYQGLLITSGMLLTSLLLNHQFGGSARQVPIGETQRAVRERVKLHWDAWSGNLTSPSARPHTPWIARILE